MNAYFRINEYEVVQVEDQDKWRIYKDKKPTQIEGNFAGMCDAAIAMAFSKTERKSE